MNSKILSEILKKVENGNLSTDEALKELKIAEMRGKDFFIDTLRNLRQGFEEIIYGKHKSKFQIEKIAEQYLNNNVNFLCTGLDDDKMNYLKGKFPDCEFLHHASMMRKVYTPKKIKGHVCIVTAGTSDLKVAYEAQETLNTLGAKSEIYADIGVAGMHRIFEFKDRIEKSDVLIAIAGMEGALPSVLGGMFAMPIIAVPTSVGYGTALNGFTPLFAMLTSCASGILVTNIDNGFGAAMAAFRILKGKYD
ncbi:MAG: nickel pincer cofactor biosynthesis protein LarB [Deferribacterales bacterium]|nr:nickel pincer cofactor biosynthesis protein LarB [Deferribacterales bacterium]